MGGVGVVERAGGEILPPDHGSSEGVVRGSAENPRAVAGEDGDRIEVVVQDGEIEIVVDGGETVPQDRGGSRRAVDRSGERELLPGAGSGDGVRAGVSAGAVGVPIAESVRDGAPPPAFQPSGAGHARREPSGAGPAEGPGPRAGQEDHLLGDRLGPDESDVQRPVAVQIGRGEGAGPTDRIHQKRGGGGETARPVAIKEADALGAGVHAHEVEGRRVAQVAGQEPGGNPAHSEAAGRGEGREGCASVPGEDLHYGLAEIGLDDDGQIVVRVAVESGHGRGAGIPSHVDKLF